MNAHHESQAFEPEVRASFRRHLADLDRAVPTRPPAVSWSDRTEVRGKVARRLGSSAALRPRRTAGPQLAAALGGVVGFVVLALIANLALRVLQPGPTAFGPTPAVLVPFQVASFGDDELTGLVLGPDGSAYAIDRTSAIVYRIDLATGDRFSVASEGQPVLPGVVVRSPRLLAAAGPDVLILDEGSQLWRWRTAPGRDGVGTLNLVHVDDSATWGDVRAIGFFVTNPDLVLYSLFVADSSAGVVMSYPASSDGSGYHARARSDNALPWDMASIEDMYIDGSVYLAGGQVIARYDAGQLIRGWAAQPPAGESRPHYTRLAADSGIKDEGNLYAYDSAGRSVVVVQKRDGMFVRRFVLPADLPDLQGMFVRPGATGSDPTLYWVSGGRLWSAVLPGVASFVPPTPPASLPEGVCTLPCA